MLWGACIILVLFALVYQRRTGPTYPVRGHVRVDSQELSFNLPRSFDGADDAEVSVEAPAADLRGTLEFVRFPTNEPWSRRSMVRRGKDLIAWLPHQPPAGKVAYRIYLTKGDGAPVALRSEPVILRFRNPVPAWIWVPHVVVMFLGMLFSSRAGLEACFKGMRVRILALLAISLLVIGGFIFGPVMQKYAFNTYWTGWPVGTDLTDNKTAVALLTWMVAYWRIRARPERGAWAIAAALVTLAVYLIPHSLMGSELNYAEPPR